jgi:hypothetical protein
MMPKKLSKSRPRPAELSAKEHARRNHIREGLNRWRNAPPGIPNDMAVEFEAAIKAGKTISDLTNPVDGVAAFVSHDRFNKRCDLNPQWGRKSDGLLFAKAPASG